MNTEVLLNSIIQTIFLPPGMCFTLIILGIITIKHFYTMGKSLIILGLSLLFILSLPLTAQMLNLLLEQEKPLTLKELKKSKAKAIVVLGAGRYKNALEYKNRIDSISKNALSRLNYAVYLYKHSKIPLLLSGGSPGGRVQPESAIMQTTLKESFNLKAKWLDSSSANTWYNAKFSAQILATENIKDIILVTHADHMPRARMAYEYFGLNVTAAPLGFKARNKEDDDYTILDILPTAEAMSRSSSAIHEFIGYAWYTLRYKGLS